VSLSLLIFQPFLSYLTPCDSKLTRERGSCVGRFFIGILADRYGRLNTLNILITFGVVCIFTIWLPFGNTLPGLYCFSVLFGLAYGSSISLSPVCIGQISRANEIGLKLGTCYSVVSFA
jgi:MFS family permease